MASEEKTFYCLRCGHRFQAEHDRQQVVERACPQCGSNSVRLQTPAARKQATATGEGG